MLNPHLILPRFQFFYSTQTLLYSFIKLFFSSKHDFKKVKKFEEQMANYFGRKEAKLVSSYRIGLYLTLKSLQLQKGDEVLLAPITIADTVNAIYLAGLIPIFLEMDPDTHCIKTSDISQKVTPRTKVLLVTYLSGIVPDIDEIQRMADAKKLIFIEDISQNMDADHNGIKVGTHGQVSIASLSCGKNISSLYGGLILTNDSNIISNIENYLSQRFVQVKKSVLFYYLYNCIKVQIATTRLVFPLITYQVLRIISHITKQNPYDPEQDPNVSLNIFRSSRPMKRDEFPDAFFAPVIDWQIDFMEHQVTKLRKGTLKRRSLAKFLIENLSDNTLNMLPRGLNNYNANSYYHFPIKCNGDKNQLRKHLFLNGIDNGSYGLNLCSEENIFPAQIYLPEAHAIKHDTLFIPIHESYTETQMHYIAQLLNRFFERSKNRCS